MSIEDWVFRHFDDPLSTESDLIVRCPFCRKRIGSEDLSGHLHISILPNTKACHCFRCGYAASWYSLIKDVSGSSYREAGLELRDSEIVPLYRLLRQQRLKEEIEQMPSSFQTLSYALEKGNPLSKKIAKSCVDYVKLRVSSYRSNWSSLLERWGLWSTEEGIGKLVLPVERGWWQEREIAKTDPKPKYLSPHLPKGDRLYNWQALGRATVQIAEGIISAACLGEDAVALCSKQATPEQMRRLGLSSTRRYLICLDADAQRESTDLATSLSAFGKEVLIRVYSEGDPASCKVYNDTEFSWKSSIEMRLR